MSGKTEEKTIKAEATGAEETAPAFEDLGIEPKILKAIKDMGFDSPTPIQAETIPAEIAGRDVIGQAQTGTGKTAAFGIPMLMKVETKKRVPQGLIMCPTRELAIQVSEELQRYARHLNHIRILPVYGGQDIVRQMRGLKDGVHIVVGTPGRIMDHMRRGTLDLTHVGMVVLDEADEMLDMGFIDDMNLILEALPKERQTVMFSATMPAEIRRIAEEHQSDPLTVRIAKKELTVPEITQYYYDVRPSEKTEVLCRLIDLYEPRLAVVFCNTKRKVDELTDEIKGRGYYAESLHGDLSQSQRDRVMKNFRIGQTQILIATDVMARGIDVEDIEAVFNYDIPQDNEYYVHRIGRTGRAGRSGYAFSLAVGRDVYKLREIQKFCRTKILPQRIPSLDKISHVRSDRVLEEAARLIEEEPALVRSMEESLDRFIFDHDSSSTELAAALLAMRLGGEDEEDEIGEAPEPRHLDELGRKRDGDRERRHKDGFRKEIFGRDGKKGKKKKSDDDDMVRLFINVGKKAHITPGDLVGAIAGEADIPGKMVGAIDIYDSYSLVDVDRKNADRVMKAMKNVKIKGLKVRMEKALGK